MSKQRKSLVATAALAFSAIAVAAIIGLTSPAALAQSAAGKGKLKLGVVSWIGYGALYVAQEKKFFGGLEVELQRIEDPAVYNSAMIKGDIDGFCNSMDSYVLAAGSGVDAQVVYVFDESAGSDGIVVKPEIKSIADLKGRSVAVQPGWTGHFFLLYISKQSGLKSKDYKIINLDADKAGAAFMSGSLDAAVTWEPWLSQINRAGVGKLLVSSKDHPGIIIDGLELRTEVIKSRPEDVKALVGGLFKAVEFWQANRQEGNEIVAKNFSLSPQEVGDMIKGVRYLARNTNREYLKKNGRAEATIRIALDLWMQAGVMKKRPALLNPVTDRFVK